jgi:hypothetical protein
MSAAQSFSERRISACHHEHHWLSRETVATNPAMRLSAILDCVAHSFNV